MRVMIVDDEEKSRKALLSILQKVAPDLDVVAQAASVSQALPVVLALKPDLLFLDVNLTDGLGFDLLEQLNWRDFKVVFITGHDHYAIRAFRFNAIDYILKPPDPDQVAEAVEKAKTQPYVAAHYDERFTRLVQQPSEPPRSKIALADAGSVTIVALNDVIRCESEGSYTTFFTTKGRKIVVSRQLKEYDELLTPCGFYRVHQSHLVNLSHVEQFIREDNGLLVMTDGSRVEVSRRRKEGVMEILMKNNV